MKEGKGGREGGWEEGGIKEKRETKREGSPKYW